MRCISSTNAPRLPLIYPPLPLCVPAAAATGYTGEIRSPAPGLVPARASPALLLACPRPWPLIAPRTLQKQLVQRSDRVKGVELHPTEPWCGWIARTPAPIPQLTAGPAEPHAPPPTRRLLANLYNGNVYVWSYADSVGASCWPPVAGACRLCWGPAPCMHLDPRPHPALLRTPDAPPPRRRPPPPPPPRQTLVKSFEVTELPGRQQAGSRAGRSGQQKGAPGGGEVGCWWQAQEGGGDAVGTRSQGGAAGRCSRGK